MYQLCIHVDGAGSGNTEMDVSMTGKGTGRRKTLISLMTWNMQKWYIVGAGAQSGLKFQTFLNKVSFG